MVGIQFPRPLVPGRFVRRVNRIGALVSDSDSNRDSDIRVPPGWRQSRFQRDRFLESG